MDVPTPAIARAVAVLELLVSRADRIGVGLSEISRALDIPKSSVANICNSLVATGLARRTAAGYLPGRKLAQLGEGYLATVDIVQEFREACRQVSMALDETIQLAVLDDDLEMIYLARHDGTHPVRLTSDAGRSLPASSTATGKAALASLPVPELLERLKLIEELPSLTPNSITDVNVFLDELETVRERGYAIDNEESVLGVVCVAATVPRAHSGNHDDPPYAVSTTLLKSRATSDRMAQLAEAVTRLCDEIGERLGTSPSRKPIQVT
jgi:DNA-binding IclR family transcriptional regulator